jgi:5,10-methylenetetrahydromethanopterin reductase
MPMGIIRPREIVDRAQKLEADGWDGMTVYDSQSLGPETIVSMTAAAVSTERLHFTIATSNPVTRHPAVAAAAMVTLTEMVGSRIRYGIGRGDASLGYTGGSPASFELFESYVKAVRRYMRGESVPFEDIDRWRLTAQVSTMQVAHAPQASRITWVDTHAAAPPIDIAATGPRALAVAGRTADRVVLGMGGHVKRVKWGIEQARAARSATGSDPATLSIAIPVSVAVTDDRAAGRRLVSNLVATSARFAAISGSVVGPVSDEEASVYEALVKSYDMNQHAGDQPPVLTDAFIDDFAIVGSPERCLERLLELHEAGVDAFQILPPMAGSVSAADTQLGYNRLVEEVLPQIRQHFA